MSKFRVGLIGYGRWAPNLARNLAKHATIAWVADPSEAAQARAREAGFVSINAPLADDWSRVDAVAIASPIAWHMGHTVDAMINEGKHVLCEKPVCVEADDAADLAEFATNYRRTLMMSAPWLYHPAIQRAGEVGRELGAPLWFRAARTSWDERPLDPLADLLPHDVGILKAWTGQRVAEVSAVVEGPTASVTLRTDGGVLGTIQYTYRAHFKDRRVELGCEHGSVEFDGSVVDVQPGGARVWDPKSCVDDDAHREPLDAMCAEFVDCCKTGRTPRFGNIDDALHVAEVIEAAHKSVSERRVVGL